MRTRSIAEKEGGKLFVIRNLHSVFCVLFSSLLSVFSSIAAPGDIDTSFSPPENLDDWVRTIVVQPDGRILIGGAFTDVGGNSTLDRIVRLLPDGSFDPSFNPPFDLDAPVRCIALQADGKVVVGGDFTDVAGVTTIDRLFRLQPDGSLDSSFVPPDNLNHNVFTVSIQPDGRILVGGAFTDVGGTGTLDRIIRLHSNGALDTSFTPPADIDGSVFYITLQPDNRIVAGGIFNDVDQVSTLDKLVRLNPDGSRDTSFTPPSNIGGIVNFTILQPDGKHLVGGTFNNVADVATLDKLVRLNSDGALDTSFIPPASLNGTIHSNAVAIQPDGMILIGGEFTDAGGNLTLDLLARLHDNGSIDATFTPPADLSDSVFATALQPDGKLLVGGRFDDAGGMLHLDKLVRIEAFVPATSNAALKVSLKRKIRKLRKQIKAAKRKKNRAKGKRLSRSLRKYLSKLRRL